MGRCSNNLRGGVTGAASRGKGLLTPRAWDAACGDKGIHSPLATLHVERTPSLLAQASARMPE